MDSHSAFRHVNDSIRQLANGDAETRTWEFICECPDLACHEWVTLTLLEFDELRGSSQPMPILAAHEPTDSSP